MSQHLTNFEENDEGWWIARCSCGWECDCLPDAETAADCGGDHRVECAMIEARADRDRQWTATIAAMAPSGHSESVVDKSWRAAFHALEEAMGVAP